MKINLAVEAGLKLRNPVMNAAGTFNLDYQSFFDLNLMGAYITKSVTLYPKPGNPQPRILETSGGMINTIGLQNDGLGRFIEEQLPRLKEKLKIPLIVSLAGEADEEYFQMAEVLGYTSGIIGLEINISCPNVKAGMVFGQNPDLTFRLVRGLRERTGYPLIVKLTPNVGEIAKIAKAAQGAGANALSLINTIKGRGYIPNGPQAGQLIVGGLSGPCIKPIALQKLSEVKEAGIEIPLIGIGGIMNWHDALDFFRAGATAIEVGTATFANPRTIPEIIKGIKGYMRKHQIENIAQLWEVK